MGLCGRTRTCCYHWRQWVWSSTFPTSHKSMYEVRTDLLVPGPCLPLCSACFLLPESLGSASICCHSRNSSMYLTVPGALAICLSMDTGSQLWRPSRPLLAASPGGQRALSCLPAPCCTPRGWLYFQTPGSWGQLSQSRTGAEVAWAQPCAHPGSCQLSGEPQPGRFFLLLGMTSLHSLQRAGREGARQAGPVRDHRLQCRHNCWQASA